MVQNKIKGGRDLSKDNEPHSMGEIIAMDLPGRSMIGLQGEKGNRVAFIEYDYAFAEGNAEELMKRWNSWEVGGVFDELLKSSQALLDNHKLITEAAFRMLQESRRKAEFTPKSDVGKDPSDAQVQADFVRERLEDR